MNKTLEAYKCFSCCKNPTDFSNACQDSLKQQTSNVQEYCNKMQNILKDCYYHNPANSFMNNPFNPTNKSTKK